jgi:hypothetical protein
MSAKAGSVGCGKIAEHDHAPAFALAVRAMGDPDAAGLDAFREVAIDGSLAVSVERGAPARIEHDGELKGG